MRAAPRLPRPAHARLVLMIGVAVVAGACSGGGSSPSAADDKVRSADVTLTAADLPGLTQDEFPEREYDPSREEEDDGEDVGPEALFIGCLGDNALFDSLGKGPRGNGSAFSNDGGTVSVASLVAFAEMEADAEQAFAGLSRPNVAPCLEEALASIYAELGQAIEASVSDLPVDTQADGAVGYRVVLDTNFPPELSYLPETVTAEMVFVRVDRGLAALLTNATAESFDDGERARLTDLLTGRLRQAS
jgi:hypothetical protein